jgi:chromosome segregation ATPase
MGKTYFTKDEWEQMKGSERELSNQDPDKVFLHNFSHALNYALGNIVDQLERLIDKVDVIRMNPEARTSDGSDTLVNEVKRDIYEFKRELSELRLEIEKVSHKNDKLEMRIEDNEKEDEQRNGKLEWIDKTLRGDKDQGALAKLENIVKKMSKMVTYVEQKINDTTKPLEERINKIEKAEIELQKEKKEEQNKYKWWILSMVATIITTALIALASLVGPFIISFMSKGG